jgi:hypothetical protein
MNKAEFLKVIDQQVEQAIAGGFSATGSDEFIAEQILNELGENGDKLPESTTEVFVALLVIFGIRRREYLAGHPAH